MKSLNQISSPDDLKGLSIAELEQVCAEVRDFIITHVSRTGGHLASSLGAVELTVAMHHVFRTPQDKIVWDVGHQAYAHKILTGRRERFASLRQSRGLCPFVNPTESEYDAFIAGHAGNAVSAASGIHESLRALGDPGRVLAVIGDGSLSNGLTFEAINFVGTRKQDMIVILNDNNMFISPKVGAMADYLSRRMTSRPMQGMREGIKNTLRDIPRVGGRLYKMAKSIEGNLKEITSPVLFEDFGFKYVGPIDGHNLAHLVEAMENISAMDGPIMLHVITEKGHGYWPAEMDPENYHGVGTFEPANGISHARAKKQTFSDVFGETLCDLAAEDERIVAISAAMCAGTGLKSFSRQYPERFFDVGIAEGHAVTMAAGMARYGLKPVVAIYSTFLQRSYDEIIHDVALLKTPVIFAVDRAGLVGADGPTHHGVFDLAFLRGIPNLRIMAPRDDLMLRAMLAEAVRHDGPVAIRYPRGVVWDEPIAPLEDLGRAQVLKSGTRAVIFTLGPMAYTALEAAEDLDDVAVVDLVSVKPLDANAVREMVLGCDGRFVVVEDGCIEGGVGTAVTECLGDVDHPLRFKLLGIPDRFVPHGNSDELYAALGLDAAGIRESVQSIL